MQYKLKLISYHLCPYVQRARITLQEKRLPYDIEFIDLSNPPNWFKKISPLGKVPILLVDQHILFESSVIMEFLDEISTGSMHPTDPLKKAHNRAWIEFGSQVLNNIGYFYSAAKVDDFNDAMQELHHQFFRLEQELSEGPFFNGREFSLVDAVFGPIFRYFDVFEEFADYPFFDQLTRIKKWRKHLQSRKSVQQAVTKDYPCHLKKFLGKQNSYLAQLLTTN